MTGLPKRDAVSDAQKEIIKNGTEMERVAVISDIIAQSWDGLSQSLTNTPRGQIIQMANDFDDIKQRVARELYPAVMTFFGGLRANLPNIEQMLMGMALALSPLIAWLGAEGIPMVTNAASVLFNTVSAIGTFIADNWGIIEPIIWGIVGALVVYNATMGVKWVLTLKSAAVTAGETICKWKRSGDIRPNSSPEGKTPRFTPAHWSG